MLVSRIDTFKIDPDEGANWPDSKRIHLSFFGKVKKKEQQKTNGQL